MYRYLTVNSVRCKKKEFLELYNLKTLLVCVKLFLIKEFNAFLRSC